MMGCYYNHCRGDGETALVGNITNQELYLNNPSIYQFSHVIESETFLGSS